MTTSLAGLSLGFCWWDLPTALILAAVVAIYAVNVSKLKKEQKELEYRLSAVYVDEATKIDG